MRWSAAWSPCGNRKIVVAALTRRIIDLQISSVGVDRSHRGLARDCAQAVLDRRQGSLTWHQQARQHLPAQDPDPWRPSRCASHQAGSRAHRCLDGRAQTSSPYRNVLIVAMANKLARIAWAVLSSEKSTGPIPLSSQRHSRQLISTQRLSVLTKVCIGTAKTTEQSQRRALNPATDNGLQRPT